MKNHIITSLMNVALVAIFAIMAMRFEKWWIILFSYLIIIAANPGEMPENDTRQEVRKDVQGDGHEQK